MATTKTIQPTGETITIPAMTDRPDASVFATDVSRITDAVNSQNQAISTHDLGTLTVDEFKTALTSFVDSSMAPNELRPIRVSISDTSDAFANTIYVGWVSKNGNNSTRTTVDLHAASTGAINKRRVTGELYNTDWHFDNLALKSDTNDAAKSAFTSWGTSLTAENFHQGLLLISYNAAYIVWFSGTDGIAIRSLRTSDGSKTGQGSISFSADAVSGTAYTITRSGTSFSLQSNSNTSFTLLYR